MTQRNGASLVASGGCGETQRRAAASALSRAPQLDSAGGGGRRHRSFGSGDIEAAMANSVIYLEAFGHIVIAWMWLEQFVAADGQVGDFYDGKRQAARYFFRYELPKTTPQLELLDSLDRTTLEMRGLVA